jgi:hypothetical protein
VPAKIRNPVKKSGPIRSSNPLTESVSDANEKPTTMQARRIDRELQSIEARQIHRELQLTGAGQKLTELQTSLSGSKADQNPNAHKRVKKHKQSSPVGACQSVQVNRNLLARQMIQSIPHLESASVLVRNPYESSAPPTERNPATPERADSNREALQIRACHIPLVTLFFRARQTIGEIQPS